MSKFWMALGLGVIALAAGGGWAQATKSPDPASASRPNDCFDVTQWRGWKSPNPDVVYIGIGQHDVYLIALSSGSSTLQDPMVHLVSQVRGSRMICSPLDIDLRVDDGLGFKDPLFIKSIAKLTPEEVAAIPAKFRP